jgi:hypothetical protein
MGTDKQHVTARVDAETRERIEQYMDEHDKESLAKAGDDLIQVGLREAQGPVVRQAREMAFTAAYHFTLVAVMVVIIGFGTRMLAPARAVAIAVVVMTVALSLVAAIEMVRAWRGQSELGAALWGERL